MKKKYMHLFLIVVFSFILYSNTLLNDFVYDDYFFITENPSIRSLHRIPSFFSRPSVGELYRPLRETLFTISYVLYKDNAFWYHIQAIFMHILIAIVGYNIILSLTKRRKLSIVSALLFSAHPVHTARVANMTASFDLLGILLMFLSVWFYIMSSENHRKRYLLASIIFFVLGLFSSEEVLMTPLYILLYELGRNSSTKEKITRGGTFIFLTMVFLALRYIILGQIGRTSEYFMGGFITRDW